MAFNENSEDAYVNILTHLYSRKANKKTFNRIRDTFKKQTGKDLCEVVTQAQKEIIDDMQKVKLGDRGAKIRTMAFKLIDYTEWLRYCPVEGRKRGK